MAGKQGVHPGTSSVGFAYKSVVITGITDDDRATCRDNFGREITVRTDVQRAKGLKPKVGENWFICRDFGGWTLAAVLGYDPSTDPLYQWQQATLLNSFVDYITISGAVQNYGVVGYRKNTSGDVLLRGVINHPDPLVSPNLTIFELPQDYWPENIGTYSCVCRPVGSSTVDHAAVDVDMLGNVKIRPDNDAAILGGLTWLILSPIRFSCPT